MQRARASSAGNITANLICDVRARDAELETLRRLEAWMKAALVQALDEERGVLLMSTA
jgi:hypothetical protein